MSSSNDKINNSQTQEPIYVYPKVKKKTINKSGFGFCMGFFFSLVGLSFSLIFDPDSKERDTFFTGWLIGFIVGFFTHLVLYLILKEIILSLLISLFDINNIKLK